MLSAQASCLEIHAFFGLMSPPSFFSRRERKEKEQRGERWEGEGGQQDLMQTFQTRLNLGKLLEKH